MGEERRKRIRVARSIGLATLTALILVLASLWSCELLPSETVTPPTWLHGSWSGVVFGSGETWTWQFSPTTIVWITPHVTLDLVEYQQNNGVTLNELANTEQEYRFEVNENGELFTFRFVRVSTTTVRYYESYGGVTLGPTDFFRE